MTRTRELESPAQQVWSNKPPDNQKLPFPAKKRKSQKPVDKLAKGAVLSLSLFNTQAAAVACTPSNSTPGTMTTANPIIPPFNSTVGNLTISPWNITATDSTISPFNITTGNVTISPWNITDSNTAITPTNSTTNGTISIPMNTNTTTNGTASPPSSRTPIQLTVANDCGESIWPGIATQAGEGPGTGGFELTPGSSRMVFVSEDWAGRIWGRTNCSFNNDGSGPSTQRGVNGYGAACLTGDCFGQLNCQVGGQVPTTLAEFTLQGGSAHNQTFYDISLVDGYNLPLAIIYHPAPNTTWIPPNLTNCACIATAGYLSPPSPSPPSEEEAYPIPYEPSQTNPSLQTWCPFPLQQSPPPKPGNNVFPYPDDAIPRAIFQPCLSPCSKTNNPADCCTGAYNSPDTCSPSLYSRMAKAVCPDAYSFAYDDRRSTFVVPSAAGGGAGWEVRFCPRGGRSTDILGTFAEEVGVIGAGGRLSAEGWGRVGSWEFVEGGRGNGVGRVGVGRGGVWAVVVGWVVVGVVVYGVV